MARGCASLPSRLDRDSMLQAVATTLRVTPGVDRTLEESLLDNLRSRSVLVVLDNPEHLLDAVSDLAGAIVRSSPNVRILATSREALDVPGEHVIRLRSLPLPETADVDLIAHNSAAQLFIERTRHADTSFTLTSDEDTRAVVEICRRLDGIPLAIELATVRVVTMSPSEIAGLLDERFRLLAGGRRATVERHQTLRATVEWSYSSLNDDERMMFDRLAVFPGSFDGEGRAGRSPEKSSRSGTSATHLAVSSRSRWSSPTASPKALATSCSRRFATSHASASTMPMTPTAPAPRTTGTYAAVAEAISDQMHGREEDAGRLRLHRELDNWHAAVMWALDSPSEDDAELAVGIVVALAQQTMAEPALGVGTSARHALASQPNAQKPTGAPSCSRRRVSTPALAVTKHGAAGSRSVP